MSAADTTHSQARPRLTWGRSLGAVETRVLACLMEKQRTTPDAYPLSLNALRLACNQSTNREPVVDYDESTIRDGLHRLERRGLTRLASGGRAAKHRHLLAEALPMQPGEQAIVCVLMLRGSQTPGELKQRTERMYAFADLAAVHDTLEVLIERELVARLERRPGQKEERYEQLLEDDEQAPGEASLSSPPPSQPPPVRPAHEHAAAPIDLAALAERVERLEREVAELRRGAGESGL